MKTDNEIKAFTSAPVWEYTGVPTPTTTFADEVTIEAILDEVSTYAGVQYNPRRIRAEANTNKANTRRERAVA